MAIAERIGFDTDLCTPGAWKHKFFQVQADLFRDLAGTCNPQDTRGAIDRMTLLLPIPPIVAIYAQYFPTGSEYWGTAFLTLYGAELGRQCFLFLNLMEQGRIKP